MDARQEKRDEVLKILQMIEDGKIDQNKALGLIAVLEGKNVEGTANNIEITDRKGFAHVFVRVLVGIVAVAVLAGVLYALFVYLPTNAPFWSVIVVYSFLALTVLAGAVVAVFAITRTMAVGRAAVESKRGRRDSSAPPSGEESATPK